MTSPLPEHPLLKRHLFAATIEEDDLFLLSEDQTWLWKNRKLGLLIRYLDGSRTVADLFELCGGEVSPPEVIYLLNQLHDEGLLAECGGPPDPECSDMELGFWHAMGVDNFETVRSLQSARVRLTSAGSSKSAQILVEALELAGVSVVHEGEVALEIVVADHYFRPELTWANEAALRRGSPWAVMKLVGQMQWIGPFFQPGRTGCMACLQDRLRRNRQVEDFVVRKTNDPSHYSTSVANSSLVARLCSFWAAQEIVLWLAGRTERLEGKLLSVSLGSNTTQVNSHILVKRLQCPVCGTPDAIRHTFPVTLRSWSEASNGAQRVSTAQATLERLNHHISPITGVVKWLADLNPDSEGLVYCYAAGHSFSLGPDTTYWLQQSLRSRTGGKGATATDAKVSAVCEAIERYCGVYCEDVAQIRGTYHSLRDCAIHPERCLNFSSRQYDRRDELNADERQGFFHLIPCRFPEDLEIDWIPLWSLTGEKVRYLPAAFCYYGHPDVERYFFCTGDANGCAAGNNVEEAIFHAFLELIERDSAAIWWYNRVTRPAIDLNTIADPYLARIREHYKRHGRELWALDITSDIGIPVVAAISRRIEGPTPDLLIGLGANLDPSKALLKAVTEVNQFLPAVWRQAPNGQTIYSWPDNVAVRFWQNETLATQPQLVPDSTVPPINLSSMLNQAGGDLCANLQTCLRIARELGLEVLALDQSHPDIDLSVVRVVVPGLRHFWRRLGPGRLYDVPVQLGWLPTASREEDLNPVSIFF
jgi:ribosomal protein S12 methylthiotransferase accessory factor